MLAIDVTKPLESAADKFSYGGQMLLIGMSVVFSVLLLLWGAAYAEEEAVRRRVLRDGVPAAPAKPPTRAEKRLEEVSDRARKAADERRAAEERIVVSRLEGLIRQALKDGRTEDAEAYLVALKSLVPGYDEKRKSAGAKTP